MRATNIRSFPVLMFFASLYTVKGGLMYIEHLSLFGGDGAGRAAAEPEQHVFADINGDDWFYFEDTTTDTSSSSSGEHCAEPMADSAFTARTISGSDTTLIRLQYHATPPHKILYSGRCSFSGVTPSSSSGQSDPDSERSRFRSQEM